MRRFGLALIVVALVAAGCGDDGAGPTTTAAGSTTVPTTATTAGTATTTATTSPATTAPPTTSPAVFSVATHGTFPDPLGAAADGQGSGCVTGGDALPDGIWFGYAAAISADSISLDLACFFIGEAAVAAATADGAEAFDFYVRNQNPKLYTVPVALSATVHFLDASTGTIDLNLLAYSDWPVGLGYNPCPGEFCGMWLFVNGGVVTEVVEQYFP